MELYFAYGSNLWIGQMRKRCPSAEVETRATLPEHRLWFPVRSRRWGAGVASIHPDPKSKVEGIVYRFSWDDLKRMDNYEGLHKGMYRREEVTLSLPQGDALNAWTYISRVEEGAPFPTSENYLATIIKGARDHQLPDDWVRFLEDFPTVASTGI